MNGVEDFSFLEREGSIAWVLFIGKDLEGEVPYLSTFISVYMMASPQAKFIWCTTFLMGLTITTVWKWYNFWRKMKPMEHACTVQWCYSNRVYVKA